MNDQDRDPVAAARRVSADSISEAADTDHGGASAVQEELDLNLWDIRLAAILNTMDIARAHGEHRDWTSEHAAQIRAMMAIADRAVVGGEYGFVPQGFGAPVRAAITQAFIRAKAASNRTAKSEAPPAPPPSSSNGHDRSDGAAA